MLNALTGRSHRAMLAVISALLSVVDVASRALGGILQSVTDSRVWALTAGNQIGAVMVRGSFADLLDPRFRRIFTDEYRKQHSDMIPVLHGMPGATQPQRDTERYSSVSGLPRMGQFTGSIDYASVYQGYDTTATYAEFAQGIQIERTLLEWDQKNVMEARPRALARSSYRRRQFDGTRHFRNMFNVDTFFQAGGDAVALCSNSHTTTTGASTTAGFDNLATLAFSGANLATLQIQSADFRDEQAEPIEVVLDGIVAPIDLYESVWEVVNSMGQVDSAQNNRNVHYGAYTIIFLRNKVDFTDTNDWAALDMTQMKEMSLWFDQVYPGGQPEFGFVEDFDTFNGKWRAYMRYTKLMWDWRWLVGSQVS